MANYECAVRSNYFSVKDEKGFLEFMKHVYDIYEDAVDVWSKRIDGETKYAFGCYGGIAGYFKGNIDDAYPEDWEGMHDDFAEGLQKFVSDYDAVIIMETGHEKLRCLVGSVWVITKDNRRYEEISDIGREMAKRMLKDKNYETVFDY